MAKLAWEDAAREFTQRSVMMELWGDTSTGKTSLALSAPGPIALIESGEKITGIIEKFACIKKIRRVTIALPVVESGMTVEQISALAVPLENLFLDSFRDAFSWARTIIVDLHSDFWKLSRLADFGAAKPAKGQTVTNYAAINARWDSMLVRGQNQNKVNVIWVCASDDEWVWTTNASGQKSSTKSGNRERATYYKALPGKCQVILNMQRDLMSGRYRALVEKAWMGDKDWRGKYIDQDQLTFANVMSTFTDTEPEEWEE